MNRSKRTHFLYWIIGLAIISMGAAYSVKTVMEIGPIATVTHNQPQIRLIDTTGVDWTIDAAQLASGNHLLIGSEDFPSALTIDQLAFPQTLVLDNNRVIVNANGQWTENFRGTLSSLTVMGTFNNSSSIEITPSDDNYFARLAVIADPREPPGQRTFSIETGSRDDRVSTRPFIVDLSADDASLVVDRDGDVGIGGLPFALGSPVFNGGLLGDLHIVGDVIYRDSSGPRWKWADLATDDFYAIDSIDSINEIETRPFRILTGAPDDGFLMNDNGDVALGTFSPDSSLHVFRDDGSAQIKVEDSSSSVANRDLIELVNNGGVRFALDNLDQNERWEFSNNSVGDFNISRNGTGGAELVVSRAGRLTSGPGGTAALDSRPNGNLFIAGTLFESSDRDKKENFEDVDCDAVLNQIAELEITTWNYKTDDEEIRHMGPVAQDFRASFQLGDSDKTIATTDKVGVSLAAIKALNSKLQNEVQLKDGQIEGLENELDEIKSRMNKLEAMLEKAASQQ